MPLSIPNLPSSGLPTPPCSELSTPSKECQHGTTAAAEGVDAEEPAEECSGLALPKWFLENNVVLSEELFGSQPRLRMRRSGPKRAETEPTPEQQNDTLSQPDAREAAGDDPSCPVDYDVDRDLYAEAEDTVFSGIQRGHASAAPSDGWADTAAFLLQSPKAGSLEFLDAVVRQLARGFETDLISVDIEDLEDLCHHFWSASDPPPDKYIVSPRPLVNKYFEEKLGDEDPLAMASRAAISAIIGGPEKKRAGGKAATEPGEQHAVIVQLRNAEAFNLEPPFKFFYEAVRTRRSNGQAILIVATATSNSTANTAKRTYAMDKVWDNLHLGWSTLVNISPRRTKKSIEARQRNKDQAAVQKRWRQLRRALGHALEPDIARDALSPLAQWPLPDLDGLQETVDEWTNETVAKVIRQICTRARRKSALELDDISEVMARVSRNKAVFKKCNDDSDDTDDDDPDLGSEGKSKAQRILDKISPNCTDDEKLFFDCFIDTDTINATAESIRVDDDIMDSLEQLLSLRVNKSYGLLASESVNGAILYGPPGTGKTHLARVLAKQSGMNLIVATPADIQSCYVGETEQRIKALFSLAAKLAPCVIFLDEGDAIFQRRTSDDKSWVRKALSQFLMEMDGLAKVAEPPFLLVATNRPQDVDDAVCRRLPHMLHVGLPHAQDRKAILDIYLREEQVGGDVDLVALAESGTKGFSGSDIRTLCVQAAMIAQREIDTAQRGGDGKATEAPRRTIAKVHVDKALARTRPSVTRESLLEIQAFASRQRRGR